jgi:hypothetical protein
MKPYQFCSWCKREQGHCICPEVFAQWDEIEAQHAADAAAMQDVPVHTERSLEREGDRRRDDAAADEQAARDFREGRR